MRRLSLQTQRRLFTWGSLGGAVLIGLWESIGQRTPNVALILNDIIDNKVARTVRTSDD